jgi:hypothetical protein
MISQIPLRSSQVTDSEWISFPGGELEGKRPKVRCPACQARSDQSRGACPEPSRGTLCFECYRAGLERERAIKAAGELDTATDERFQTTLPFEPVDRVRLEQLRALRASERATMQSGAGRFVDRRRQAQIAARHALQQIAHGLDARGFDARSLAAATRAAELQLPEAWLPFVVSR